ncbi:hypothetical protein BDN72DRAFT_900683 [Pluteus cervinus]|uniref:Uncharacterized protein n=1 Tax=Pluteus cervinus TaxID=181527 RepID=A0ACD3AIJ8_9AGAR|nr:hypothetical protein BDN72DRAFT_900683 [Pluteus cervinus]
MTSNSSLTRPPTATLEHRIARLSATAPYPPPKSKQNAVSALEQPLETNFSSNHAAVHIQGDPEITPKPSECTDPSAFEANGGEEEASKQLRSHAVPVLIKAGAIWPISQELLDELQEGASEDVSIVSSTESVRSVHGTHSVGTLAVFSFQDDDRNLLTLEEAIESLRSWLPVLRLRNGHDQARPLSQPPFQV